eukprot:CAMPEP_0172666920 /NCGR_PEP_ID=MMETSP1074-20121228/8106_1 /TAXON_ID=2916 /ORGANISM="Ceratium fusus, Strain PA161109" /LENGTH=141 /DNA_ID=CAMNT_0013483363 /DNA_START=111 /DNA_END=537 /DNA_ORIENTATION=+
MGMPRALRHLKASRGEAASSKLFVRVAWAEPVCTTVTRGTASGLRVTVRTIPTAIAAVSAWIVAGTSLLSALATVSCLSGYCLELLLGFGPSSSVQPLRAWHTVSQFAPPEPFTQTVAATRPTPTTVSRSSKTRLAIILPE